MNKSYIYSQIPSHLKSLAGKIIEKNNNLKKSSEVYQFGITKPLEDAVENLKDGNVIGDLLYKQFKLLKQDFEANAINLVRYVEYLNQYKKFFELADLEQVDVPLEIKAKEILQEINKYIG